MCKADKENVVTSSTMTGEYLYCLRTTTHVRLNHAAWRSACDAGVALRRPTHRGCGGGGGAGVGGGGVGGGGGTDKQRFIYDINNLIHIPTDTIPQVTKIVLSQKQQQISTVIGIDHSPGGQQVTRTHPRKQMKI